MFMGFGELRSIKPNMKVVMLGEMSLIMLLNRLLPKHKYVSVASGIPVLGSCYNWKLRKYAS